MSNLSHHRSPAFDVRSASATKGSGRNRPRRAMRIAPPMPVSQRARFVTARHAHRRIRCRCQPGLRPLATNHTGTHCRSKVARAGGTSLGKTDEACRWSTWQEFRLSFRELAPYPLGSRLVNQVSYRNWTRLGAHRETFHPCRMKKRVRERAPPHA